MALAVVNYPTISDKDFQWIQSIRKEHDHLFYNIIKPHLTFVFPTDNIQLKEFISHIKNVSAKFNPIEFTIRCATVGDPDFWDHAHVFLIPDEGFSKIVKLHDAFYTGILQPELRLDLPFVPHIGIASHPSPEYCKILVDKLNAQNFEISGIVENLDIIEFDGKTVNTIEKIDVNPS